MVDRHSIPSRPSPLVALAPEDELLLCCARVSPSAEAIEAIERLTQGPLDWERLFERSWWHRVRPLTFRHLGAHAVGAIPAAVRQQFIEHTTELAQRNRRLFHALQEVGTTFEQSGLRLLVFKGPTLAIDAYGDLSFRECGDLDLLLHPGDVLRATALLESIGFRRSRSESLEELLHGAFACEFDRSGVQLDIHWDLAPGWLNYRIDFDALWESGASLVDGSHFARKMAPEVLLVVLSVHGAKHWWERLRWIVDIAELVSSGQVRDWDRVAVEAERAHSRRSVSLGLWLAHRLLDARLPREVERRLDRERGMRRLGRQVAQWLALADRAAAYRSLPARFSFRMGLCERWRDRLPQIWRYLRERPSRKSPASSVS